MLYGSTLHIPPTSYHLLAAQKKPYQKACPLTKNIEDYCGEKSENVQENVQVGWKQNTERAVRVGKDQGRR